MFYAEKNSHKNNTVENSEEYCDKEHYVCKNLAMGFMFSLYCRDSVKMKDPVFIV